MVYDHDDSDGYAASNGYIRMTQSMISSTHFDEFIAFMSNNNQKIKALKYWDNSNCCLRYGGGDYVLLPGYSWTKVGPVCGDLNADTLYSITDAYSGTVGFTFSSSTISFLGCKVVKNHDL